MNSVKHNAPIAIVGMGGLFPDAKNIQQYWENILAQRDCIVDVPPSRWSIEDYYDPDPAVPDKTYCKVGGFLPDIDFNPLEFGLPPNILEVTDVSQLLALLVAKSALKDAGYLEASDSVRQRTGVILGIGGGQKLITPLTSRLQYPIWNEVMEASGISAEDAETISEKVRLGHVGWNENSFPGMLGNVIAGRVANRLDLGGINCVVDAACASSLSALRMAAAELSSGRSDMMITGGVDTDNSIFMYMCFSKTPAFSRSGMTRPFDAAADGMLLGEGIGMVVLKRLEDAERDGDRIYSVIRGIGASSDGLFNSIYAPRASGQELALRRAYEEAGFEAQSVGLIEGHGTGTKAGDPTELDALQTVFGEGETEAQTIALGSVKSQIGHTKSAAGAASLIKVAMALHHKVLPPTINITEPTSSLGEKDSPIYLNTSPRPWLQGDKETPRRAGVSSFGFGGTNFHVALEEYQPEQSGAYRVHRTAQSIVLDAANRDELLVKCRQWHEKLASENGQEMYWLLVEDTRSDLIDPQNVRVGFTAASTEEARSHLQTTLNHLPDAADEPWTHPQGIYYRPSGVSNKDKVVVLFPGQGSQYVEMGRTLALNYPEIRHAFQAMDKAMVEAGLSPVSKVVYPTPVYSEEAREAQVAALRHTEYAQPAIGALSAGLYALLKKAGLQPDFAAGHSFGELTALWASGALAEADYYQLVSARGVAMAAPAEPGYDAGAMMAVNASADEIEQQIGTVSDVTHANLNSPKQTVLAGPTQTMAEVQTQLTEAGLYATPLPVSAAFHTPLVAHAVHPFEQTIDDVEFQAPQIPVYANSSAQPYSSDTDEMRSTLAGQLLSPVLFRETIENLYEAGGRIFVEIGPQSILTNLVGGILRDQPHTSVAVNANARMESDRQLHEAIVQLRVIGLPLNDFDEYAIPNPETEPSGAYTVTLNGGNYVSDATKNAYSDALVDGFKVTLPTSENGNDNGNGLQAVEAPTVPTPAVPTPAITSTPAIASAAPSPIDAAPLNEAAAAQESLPTAPVSAPDIPQQREVLPAQSGELAHILTQFSTIQAEMLDAHQRYLDHHAEETQTFFSLLGTQAQNGDVVAAQLTESMRQFQAHQADTLRVHEHYLTNQMTYLDLLYTLIEQEHGGPVAQQGTIAAAPTTPSLNGAASNHRVDPPTITPSALQVQAPPPTPQPVIPAPNPATPPVTAVAPPAVNNHPASNSASNSTTEMAGLTGLFKEVVSEKTGFPVELLEMSQDMQTDLGIDSIKRVEILGAVQERIPSLPRLRADELAELRSLQQVVDYVQAQMATDSTTQEMATAPSGTDGVAATDSDASHSSVTPEMADLTELFKEVVSEKTGFPVELLDMGQDMQTDLGIDSIKRVEILGAVQEQIPSLPRLRADELAELRTLQQVVDYVQAQMAPGGLSQQTVPLSAPPAAIEPDIAPSASSSTPDMADLTALFKEVVSEKTGFPVELLDMGQDMQTDLGIDSIKRVEILGAVQERIPSLPRLRADELAELRTLQQVVDHVQSQMVPESSSQQAAPAASSVASSGAVDTGSAPQPTFSASETANLTDLFKEVVSEKTGFPVALLEMSQDMQTDLGIDSIKRVEILGAVQERVPSLPRLRADELAELRTLQQVVDYVQAQMTPATSPQQTAPATSSVASSGAVDTGSAPQPASSASEIGDLTELFKEVVSEKTGFPVALLEMSQDMQTDLGIDSIKRVEILGAVQERVPSLPRLRADELAELRTLQQIVDYVQAQMTPENASQPITSVASVEPSNGNANGATIHDTTIDQYIVKPASIPLPDVLEQHPTQGHCALVTSDGTALTREVASRLLDDGWPVVVLDFPSSAIEPYADLPDSVDRYALADFDEAHLVERLTTIQSTHGPVARIVHLNRDWTSSVTSDNSPIAGWIAPAEEQIVAHVFLMAKHLASSLNHAGTQGRAAFLAVTRLNGRLGIGEHGNGFSAAGGGLFGLVKSLNQEWASVYCRAVDLAPMLDADVAAKHVLAELQDPDLRLLEVGYSELGRMTLIAEASSNKFGVNGKVHASEQVDQVFVVSGGARGITARCVIELAQQTAATFILLGRTTTEVEPEWAHGITDGAALKQQIVTAFKAAGTQPTLVAVERQYKSIIGCREIEQTLQEIRATGNRAEYVSVDVCNLEAVKAATAGIVERVGPITGLIHGAGVLADKRIEEKSAEDFANVYTVKVDGLRNLLSTIALDELHQVILFSSAAGFYGNAGQTDYALANEVLNKMGYLLAQRLPSCRVRSINWGPWDGGMVTPALRQLFAERNVHVIPEAVGTRIFVEQALSEDDDIQIVVGGALGTPPLDDDMDRGPVRIRRRLTEEDNPFLKDHVIGEHAVLPLACAQAWIADACEAQYPGLTIHRWREVSVLNGIVFDGSSADEITVDITEAENDAEQVVLDVMIGSQTASGQPRFHYRATCELQARVPNDGLPIQTFDRSQAHSAHNYYEDGTLFHGPGFQSVQEILKLDEHAIVLSCQLPALPQTVQGQFPVKTFNPFTADAIYQALLIWARSNRDAASLPLQAGNVLHYRPIPFDRTFYVAAQFDQFEESQAEESQIKADVAIYDEEGRLCYQTTGASVTVSRQLNLLFTPGA